MNKKKKEKTKWKRKNRIGVRYHRVQRSVKRKGLRLNNYNHLTLRRIVHGVYARLPLESINSLLGQ